MKTIRNELLKKFADYVYRHAYADDYLDSAISTQIRVLREQRGWSQTRFARSLGMRPGQVCRMESVSHSGWQLRTLQRIAKAFDLFLVVKFESFGAALADIENFGRGALERPSFKDDPVFMSEEPFEEPQVGNTGVGEPRRVTIKAESSFGLYPRSNVA